MQFVKTRNHPVSLAKSGGSVALGNIENVFNSLGAVGLNFDGALNSLPSAVNSFFKLVIRQSA